MLARKAVNTFEIWRVDPEKRFRQVDQLVSRLNLIDANDLEQPLPWPLCYFGFSQQLTVRLGQHEKHSPSNYIM